MGIRLFLQNGSLFISPEDLIQYNLKMLKISKPFVFLLRTSSEYLIRYRQGSVFKIRFQGSDVKKGPCPYLFEHSPDVLKKKTRVLNIFNTGKKCFMKIKIEVLGRYG